MAQPTYKTPEGFQVHTSSRELPAWVGMDWRGKEGIWLVLTFYAVASELGNIDSSLPGVPFLSINNDNLCPYSLLGAFLRYRAHNSVCLFSE